MTVRWILLYLLIGAGIIAGIGGWASRGSAETDSAPQPADLGYPIVTPPWDLDADGFKSAHLDGWKWFFEHLRDGQVATGEDQLRGYLVPGDEVRNRGFLTGYAAARGRWEATVAARGAETAASEWKALRRRRPGLYELSVFAPAP